MREYKLEILLVILALGFSGFLLLPWQSRSKEVKIRGISPSALTSDSVVLNTNSGEFRIGRHRSALYKIGDCYNLIITKSVLFGESVDSGRQIQCK